MFMMHIDCMTICFVHFIVVDRVVYSSRHNRELQTFTVSRLRLTLEPPPHLLSNMS